MARSWTQFQKIESPTPAPQMTKADADQWLEYIDEGLIEVWINNLYQVIVYRGKLVPCVSGMQPQMPVWLSLRRTERSKLARDWRDLQRIKNEILGPEVEAVELFPKESRLVDEADQTHLWGFEHPKAALPFGYVDRLVQDYGGAELIEGSQRAFEFPPGEYHVPPAAERRVPMTDDDLRFLVDIIQNGPQSDADHQQVEMYREALDKLAPQDAEVEA